MTTVGQLVKYLQEHCKDDDIVVTNQYGGDWSEEYPINLDDTEYYEYAYVHMSEDRKEFHYTDWRNMMNDEDTTGYVRKNVVRLIS
jgi:hypothetical protein